MSKGKSETPAALGYRWPAEWEPHAATWLSWPRNPNTWPGKFGPVPEKFAAFVRLLAEYEPVHVLAGGEAVWRQAQALVGRVPNVTLYDIETNDAWCRDYGPTFLSAPPNLPAALVDWEYNAWGGKYPPFDQDNQAPRRIADLKGRRRFVPGIVLEGGAVDGNGRGTVLTTEQCLLNPNRNGRLSREQIEGYLLDYLCAKKVLWLSGGEISGDDTDGHIDQLARFVNASTVVAPLEEDKSDENHAPLAENFRQLQAMADQDGRPLTIVPLPMPRPKHHDGQRLPAGYCNFYIANGVVVVPEFGDPADNRAIEILSALFPDRNVRGLDSLDLIWGLGSFHCLSQQEPA